jgi:hypothetical protein
MIPRSAAIALTATGPLLLLGAAIHPHAPDAQSMAEVLYTQAGQALWWPAHVSLLAAYVAFAVFLRGASRSRLPAGASRVARIALPIAFVCVFAMVVHLLLPIGRGSVADGQEGWVMWAKGFGESFDAVWALVMAVVAWSFGRAGVVGNRAVALVGMVGALGFGIFSAAIPLTGVVVPLSVMHSLVPIAPVPGLLMVVWTVAAGLPAALQRGGPAVSPEAASL